MVLVIRTIKIDFSKKNQEWRYMLICFISWALLFKGTSVDLIQTLHQYKSVTLSFNTILTNYWAKLLLSMFQPLKINNGVNTVTFYSKTIFRKRTNRNDTFPSLSIHSIDTSSRINVDSLRIKNYQNTSLPTECILSFEKWIRCSMLGNIFTNVFLPPS